MNTCLVTKLKSTVDNPDLPKFDELRLEVLPSPSGVYNINLSVVELNTTKIYTNSPYIYFTLPGDEETQLTEYVVNTRNNSIPDALHIHNTSNQPQFIHITNKNNIKVFAQTATEGYTPTFEFGPNSDKINLKYFSNVIGLICHRCFDTYHLLNGDLLDLAKPKQGEQQYIWSNSITGSFESFVEKWAPQVSTVQFGIMAQKITFDGKPINSIGTVSMGDGTNWIFENGVYILKIRGIENAATYDPSAPEGSRWTYTYE